MDHIISKQQNKINRPENCFSTSINIKENRKMQTIQTNQVSKMLFDHIMLFEKIKS